MSQPIHILSDDFIESNTDFIELIAALQAGFGTLNINVPKRHHHSFKNTVASQNSTMLLMPAWEAD